jgi:hypothetical protein
MPINNEPDNTIRTTDISRASIIMAQGVPMLDVRTNRRGSLEFVFDNTDDKAKIASAAIMNNLPIPIGTYLECTRKFREILATHRLVTTGADKRADKENAR